MCADCGIDQNDANPDPLEEGREEWRVGTKVPVNVYEGDRPICQCHTVLDAKRIVEAVNGTARATRERELLRILGKIHEQATRRWREGPENDSLANDLDNIVSLAANVISTSPIAKAALSETQPEEKMK